MSRVRREVSEHAAPMRREMTEYERVMWFALRDRRFASFKFRRQHSIGPYVADFACIAAMLVFELDGGQHGEAVAYDQRRTAFLAAQGWRVLRFWNADLTRNRDGIMATIGQHLTDRTVEPVATDTLTPGRA